MEPGEMGFIRSPHSHHTHQLLQRRKALIQPSFALLRQTFGGFNTTSLRTGFNPGSDTRCREGNA